nr:MAG: hypothetical protein CSA83_01630 [Actinomycetales bacterium]
MVFGGISTAREWESGTVRGLGIATCGPWQIYLGKLTANTIRALIIGTIVLVLALLTTDYHPNSPWWMSFVVLILVAVFSTALGTIAGTAGKRYYLTLPAAGITAMLLWFLSGGFQDLIAVRGTTLYLISRFLPTSYAFDTLRTTSGLVWLSLLLLTIMTMVTTLLGVVVFHRALGSSYV